MARDKICTPKIFQIFAILQMFVLLIVFHKHTNHASKMQAQIETHKLLHKLPLYVGLTNCGPKQQKKKNLAKPLLGNTHNYEYAHSLAKFGEIFGPQYHLGGRSDIAPCRGPAG